MHAAAHSSWLSRLYWQGASAAPVLGIDLAPTAVHVVELEATARGPRISHWAQAPLTRADWQSVADGDVSALVDALRQAVKASGSRRKSVALALPASAVITRTLSLPQPAHDDELELLVEADAAQSLPFPRDEISLDFTSLGPSQTDDSMIDVLLVAARSERIVQRIAWAEAAGLHVAAIGVESHAVVAAIASLCGDTRHAESILHFSGDGAHCLFVRGERLLFERELGKPLPPASPPGDGDGATEAWLDAACLEWQRHSQLFAAASTDAGVDRLHLVGAGAQGPVLAAGMRERLAIDVDVPDPFTHWDCRPGRNGPQADGHGHGMQAAAYSTGDDGHPSCLLACGLALRGLQA